MNAYVCIRVPITSKMHLLIIIDVKLYTCIIKLMGTTVSVDRTFQSKQFCNFCIGKETVICGEDLLACGFYYDKDFLINK